VLHRFWLIRHALVHADSLSSLYGTNDVPVCGTTMEADAERYAALACRLPHPAQLVCSPLMRTQHTAEAIIRAGYPDQKPLIDAAFIEQDFGDLQGMPIKDFDSRPIANGESPHEPGKRHPFWPIHAAETPPGGESFAAMITRVGAGLERLLTELPGQNTIIVSHGGAIRAACAYALGLTPHQALCLAVDNISLTRIEHNRNGWRLVSMNEQICPPGCATPAKASRSGAQTALEQLQGASR
jgi:broad specificity phosphatase PhoE